MAFGLDFDSIATNFDPSGLVLTWSWLVLVFNLKMTVLTTALGAPTQNMKCWQVWIWTEIVYGVVVERWLCVCVVSSLTSCFLYSEWVHILCVDTGALCLKLCNVQSKKHGFNILWWAEEPTQQPPSVEFIRTADSFQNNWPYINIVGVNSRLGVAVWAHGLIV